MKININENKIKQVHSNIDKEYDLRSRLSRYQSTTPELVEFAALHGLEEIDAFRALFVSDYIVTSSEVPLGSIDEERRISIFRSFSDALYMRTKDSDKIMRIFYLAYNVAVQVKRNDSYLCNRGIEKNVRTILLIDSLVLPYLKFSREYLEGETSYFEIGILKSALLRKFPDNEIETLDKTISLNNNNLMNILFKIMDDYMNKYSPTVNDSIVLPYINESQILYINNLSRIPIISQWMAKKRPDKQCIDKIEVLRDFMEQSDKDIPFIYLRGKITDSNSNIMLIRSPFVNNKPICLIRTPSEEINVTEMIALLDLYSSRDTHWKYVPDFLQSFTFSSLGENTSRNGEDIGLEENTQCYMIPTNVCKAMGIHILSDLRLFEIFDTIRESEYQIVGALESNFDTDGTTIYTTSKFSNIDSLTSTLEGLGVVVKDIINQFFDEGISIEPTEIIFMSEADRKLIISFAGDKKRLVGTIALTYIKDITNWRERASKVETAQRRTLHMRTGQLLSARTHTPLDQAIQRIYRGMDWDDRKEQTINKAILKMY